MVRSAMTSLWSGELVRLRAVEPEDWAAFAAFDRDTADQRATDRVFPPRSEAGYRAWAQEQSTDSDAFRLVIEAIAGSTFVGSINTFDARPLDGCFSYGLGVLRRYRRKGYAREAITLLLGYMFGERRYQKCDVGVYAFNEDSLALHHKLGFAEEGRLRRQVFTGGTHHDLVRFGMTTEEFTALMP
ncbi:GNAT family N-acetyltransferase [Allokutzneria sp. A3M-2-11 16]|uniref:GNAT family N-acetyltransferase n=1 Tax=Allokutzneria sp. A3M-2-11 16 TaxID=2962043 RepID=UPI0020B644F5|nr:GNAT family protein [Allokutzneria sp. A3M-2-11 16]MCP3803520.1 GNAT family N-acetyltransferase [Allokutzneria sp. A3M-2-11 16]